MQRLRDGELQLSAMKPETNGSEAPISVRPTIILAGKPTAKMFICGTTLRDDAERGVDDDQRDRCTGAPIMKAETKMPENATCAPWTIEPMAGASSSGTAS